LVKDKMSISSTVGIRSLTL